MMAPPSVAVIGGGIIGGATAQELAPRGCRVTLLERASPGVEASSAAGLLAPRGPSPAPGPFHRLAIESWRHYPGVAGEQRELTGVDVERSRGPGAASGRGRPTTSPCWAYAGVPGLFAATPHYRSGIRLGPITATVMACCIADGDVPAAITPFLPDRFPS